MHICGVFGFLEQSKTNWLILIPFCFVFILTCLCHLTDSINHINSLMWFESRPNPGPLHCSEDNASVHVTPALPTEINGGKKRKYNDKLWEKADVYHLYLTG